MRERQRKSRDAKRQAQEADLICRVYLLCFGKGHVCSSAQSQKECSLSTSKATRAKKAWLHMFVKIRRFTCQISTLCASHTKRASSQIATCAFSSRFGGGGSSLRIYNDLHIVSGKICCMNGSPPLYTPPRSFLRVRSIFYFFHRR